MTLIYVPKPFKDESAASIIIRASAKNGYRTTSSLLKAYGINVYITSLNSYFFDREKFSILLQNLSLDESYKFLAPSNYGPTKKIKKFYNNIIIFENFLSPDGCKLCICCINENNYLRINWMIRYVTICIKHSFRLLEKCPQCKLTLNANRNIINICGFCDYDFSENIQEKVSTLEINANLWLMNIIKQNDFRKLKDIKNFFDVINNTRKTFKELKLETPNIILGYLYFKKEVEYKKVFFKFLKENSSIAHPRILSIYFISSYQNISIIHEKILTTHQTLIKEHNYSNHNFLISQRSACISLKICKYSFKRNFFSTTSTNYQNFIKVCRRYNYRKNKTVIRHRRTARKIL